MTRLAYPSYRKGGGTSPLLLCGLILTAILAIILPQPASADLTSSVDTYVTISCGLPGQVIEAGETANFSLEVVNYGQENNKRMWVESSGTKKFDWDIRFLDGDIEVNKISLPYGTTRMVTLCVETSSDTPEGE